MHDPLAAIRKLPRVHLAHLPTALEAMPRLGAALGIRSLFVKRDDCTGLGMGGNKTRKLEFSLAAAQAIGADCVICGGVAQSNTVRQVAAACAKLGIECHIGIMQGRLRVMEPGYDATGNILLDRLFGAIIHDIRWDEDRNAPLESLAAELRASGRRVFRVPYGISDALGAMGYALAAREIVHDCPNVAWIVHASGSAGTQAGLLAGLLALGHPAHVIGVDVDAEAVRVANDVRWVGRKASAMLGVERSWTEHKVEVAGNWSGPAYGEGDSTTEEAIGLAARLEGLALDPVYSGKGMAGLIVSPGKADFKLGELWFGFTQGVLLQCSHILRPWRARAYDDGQDLSAGRGYREPADISTKFPKPSAWNEENRSLVIKCGNQDLTLQTVLSDEVPTVRQTFGQGF